MISNNLTLNGLNLAIEKAGSQNKLAKLLGVQSYRVSRWVTRDKKMPLDKVPKASRLLSIPMDILRPDIEW